MCFGELAWKGPTVNAILPSMSAPPFHRRILPWVFAVCFLAVAPVVIFYTAGYRYNAKKGKIERNGTVIIDSRPRSASISLDGRDLADKTPITLQDMAPGNHRFDVRKDGYTSWTKTLDVRPEYVTFINNIRLWKQSEPSLLSSSTADLISLAPNDDYLLLLSNSPAPSYRVTDAQGVTRMQGKLTPTPKGKLRAVWQSDGSAVLLEPVDGGSAYLLDTAHGGQAMPLPEAIYRFTRTELVGNDGTALISIRLSDLSLRRSPLGGQMDAGDSTQIRMATGTRDRVLVLTDNPSEGVVLPDGGWELALEGRDRLLLRDKTSWLSVDATSRPPASHQATGDMLRPLTLSRVTSYLLVNGGELWLWDPAKEPILLRRQSDTIIEAGWHYAGGAVFYATDKTVTALDLDPRDGYLETTLADFAQVKSMTVSTKGVIYVAGVKGGTDGIWTIATE